MAMEDQHLITSLSPSARNEGYFFAGLRRFSFSFTDQRHLTLVQGAGDAAPLFHSLDASLGRLYMACCMCTRDIVFRPLYHFDHVFLFPEYLFHDQFDIFPAHEPGYLPYLGRNIWSYNLIISR